MELKRRRNIPSRPLAAGALFAALLCGFGARLFAERARPDIETAYVLVSEKQFDGSGALVYSEEHEYDGRGRELSTNYFDNRPFYAQNGHSRKEYSYNENDKLLSVLYFSGDSLISRREFEYYGSGTPRRELYYKCLSGDFELESELYFDESENLLSETRYKRSGEALRVDYTEKYTYDERGNLLSTLRTDGSGTELFNESCEYDYDENGRLLKKQTLDRGIYPRARTEYSYDENGNMLSRREYDAAGKLRESCEYAYDRDGNLKSEKLFSADGVCSSEKFYDANGALLKEERYRSDGSVSTELRYGYDSAGIGICTEIFYYGANGEAHTERVEYAYDENGNLLSETGAGFRREYEYAVVKAA